MFQFWNLRLVLEWLSKFRVSFFFFSRFYSELCCWVVVKTCELKWIFCLSLNEIQSYLGSCKSPREILHVVDVVITVWLELERRNCVWFWGWSKILCVPDHGMFFSVNFNESTGSSGISAENMILVFKSVSSVDILKKFSYDSSLWWVECLDWESTLIFGERGLRFGLWIVDCMFNMSIDQVWIYYRVSEDYGLTIDLVEDVLDNYYWAH